MAEPGKAGIVLSDEKKKELLEKTVEHFVRFISVANAGGTLATITVLSSTAKNGEILIILAVPLAFFSLGILFAVLMTLNIMFHAARVVKNRAPVFDPSFQWIAPFLKKHEDAVMFGTVVCFTLGCVSGILIIAFAPSV